MRSPAADCADGPFEEAALRVRSILLILPLAAVVVFAASAQKEQPGADRRSELEEILKQRYRLTMVGASMLGLKGSAGSLRRAGGVVELRREGFYGSFTQNGPATMSIRGEAVEVSRGHKDFAFPAGEQFYIHSVYVGQDLVSLGLLSTRSIATPRGTGRLWAAVDFYLPVEVLTNVNTGAIFSALDQWLLLEGQRPAAAAPAAPAPPPPPAPRAELKPGMTREEVVAALGAPQREVSYGTRTWMTYSGMVVLLENGKLVSVDRSGQPPARVTVRSEPDGADVFLGDNFVGSTPATLELPAGSYKVSVRLAGFKDWQRDVQVLGGSELTLRVRLEK